jgi:Na+/H+ antiporter NhaD/arsenite permease-like protein
LQLFWLVGLTSFFLSAFLDNLTTTIVMIAVIRRLLTDQKDKLLFAGTIVIAANAGGVWSPMGDVTTTMLWISERVSTLALIKNLFIPSILSVIIPMLIISRAISKINLAKADNQIKANSTLQSKILLVVGLGLLMSIPLMKSITHLPPFILMLFDLAIIWTFTEFLHYKKENEIKQIWTVSSALQKIDVPSILFFSGILFGVGALEQAGWLHRMMDLLNGYLPNYKMNAIFLGVLSAIIDNVPLVAASLKMFSLEVYPLDHPLWHFIAFTSGTGGSLLIIGSAAGVAAMGMENISFGYYLKKFTLVAMLGFLGGIVWLLLV